MAEKSWHPISVDDETFKILKTLKRKAQKKAGQTVSMGRVIEQVLSGELKRTGKKTKT